MAITRKPLAALAAAAVAVSLASCGGASDTPSDGDAKTGGTLYYVTGPRLVEHWDPQRMYIGRDLTNANRLIYRSLVSFPASEDEKEATTPVADLATDTGTATDGGKTWSFTVKDDVKWQDGKAITCEDFKYGLSRGFATDVITGGPNYILNYLDVPKGKDGLPLYNGPYKGDNQADFDKAVSCEGQTITYRFNKPWPDFPLSVASLAFANPFREDQDKGNGSNFTVFASGPYKLDGAWKSGKGGTFIRNTEYDAKTDSTEIRKALPDKIVFSEGNQDEAVYDRLFADAGNDKFAVTDRRVPPSYYSQLADAGDRYKQVASPYTDYVLPNFNSPVFKNKDVRQALNLATDRTAWINAGGGPKAFLPAYSIVNPAVPGYEKNPAFADVPQAGDADAAKALLTKAGVSLPVKIKFTYSGGTPTSDKQASALAAGWKKAGFDVQLDPLTDTYYDVIQKPDADFDVTWGGWGADWPSIGTVIPPLFDSRINLTSASNGQDYGNYKSDEANKLIDEAQSAATLEEANAKYAELDAFLGEDVAYIPLEIMNFNFLHGSKVSGYMNTAASNGYPDLGPVGVTK
ncbi:ABC transporter substrate-binding protein [Nocardioides cavernaquae]|uniref:ABC transporter substrate-binding protein n=1 Tax=Nocardioides cavernaquae TaxID=2321396 RepID=A0A3A5HHM1_9ACTN|nr:ABC transporter substrate-binding protein [Nocardioides cavernaquae]RJS47380.1 ABC transporter substrate-binding protein [Nocardioides cavernaquae]